MPGRIRWTLELLAPQPAEHVLEVGCGPGHALPLIAARLTTGTLTAIDRSAIMVARARARSAACAGGERIRVEQAVLAQVTAPATLGRHALARFDSAFAVNVNAFWTAPAPNLASLRRLLGPDGRLLLVYEPPVARLAELRARVPSLLAAHGFRVETVVQRAAGERPALGVRARAD